MSITIKQFSSLEKIISVSDMSCAGMASASALAGERFSYQVAISTSEPDAFKQQILQIRAASPIEEYIRLYTVKNIAADFPYPEAADSDYITDKPMMLPDLLVPLEEQNSYVNFVNNLAVIWVEICLPHTAEPRECPITLNITGRSERNTAVDFEKEATFMLEILPAVLPEQSLICSQWFHIDCIASAHRTEIYSEEHWELIDKYMAMAAELGINMLLTPVITPPLDTAPGTCRPCTQLVDIEKTAEGYRFDFSRLRRYISLGKRNGIKYYEISHFFTQWGCAFCPNIRVKENGEEKLMFGWHISSRAPSYAELLSCLIPALLEVLREEGILEVCYFHISDEPTEAHLEAYEYAHSLLKPLLGDCKVIDAVSDIKFYERGLIERPVCSNNHIEPFLEKNIPNLWTYYCCEQVKDVSNRFLSMPSYRNRIIGLQLYKYGMEGFLQWGYNFYYSQLSLYSINPYITTSADGSFPSGDAFCVYPGERGPLPSIRAFVFREALQDISVCRLLEKKIGKEAVIRLIEEEAGMEITFKNYPRNSEFLNSLMSKIKSMIIE